MLPEAQDDYLEEGYFRMGHTIKRTRFLFVQHQLWSAIWSRVPIDEFTFSKSQRKLLRKGDARFDLEFGPYEERVDQDLIYHRYQKEHPLEVGSNLGDVLGHHHPTHVFTTHTLRILADGQLVAFSCFDLGENTMASLMGCYHPAYKRWSLGIYSMLAELRHAQVLGLKHYHPGYCVPGLEVFAYKQRLPNLQGKAYTSDAWTDLTELLNAELPHLHIERRLDELADCLTTLDIGHQRQYLPLSEMMPLTADGYGSMPEPVMLELTEQRLLGEVFVGYNLLEHRYEAWFGQPVADLYADPDFDDSFLQAPPQTSLKFYQFRTLLFVSSSAETIAPYLSQMNLLRRILEVLPSWAQSEDAS